MLIILYSLMFLNIFFILKTILLKKKTIMNQKQTIMFILETTVNKLQ